MIVTNYDGFLADIYDFCPYFKGRGHTAEFYLNELNGTCSNVLELGTATGSITIPLAVAGYLVDTVDYSKDMQRCAQKKAADQGWHILKKIHFILEDVTCFVPSKKYEATIIPDSLLTVLPNDEDRAKILTMCYNALKDGGLLMLDVFKPIEHVIQKQTHKEVSRFRDKKNDVYIVTVNHTVDPSQHLHTCVYDYRKWPNIKEKTINIQITYKYLYINEIEKMLTQIGFCDIRVTEIFDGHINFITAHK